MYFHMTRPESVGGATISPLILIDTGETICDILEDQDREIPGVDVAIWKVHGETAIPRGVYDIVLEDSPRFGPDTMTLKDVNGFKYIRIHGGNDAEDTEGCLLTGQKNSPNTVALSQVHLKKLKALVVPAIKAGERVQIEIA